VGLHRRGIVQLVRGARRGGRCLSSARKGRPGAHAPAVSWGRSYRPSIDGRRTEDAGDDDGREHPWAGGAEIAEAGEKAVEGGHGFTPSILRSSALASAAHSRLYSSRSAASCRSQELKLSSFSKRLTIHWGASAKTAPMLESWNRMISTSGASPGSSRVDSRP